MKQTICPNCGGSLKSLAIGWRCKKCKGFISYQDGKFYEYVEKPFIPPQTNADRIRAMSDEEFVNLFGYNSICDYVQDHSREHCEKQGSCAKCLVKWLQQPAGE